MYKLLPYISQIKTNEKRMTKDNTIMEIQYSNLEEPKESRFYLIQIKQQGITQTDWTVENILLYNLKNKSYENIGRMYSFPLIEQIKNTVLFKLEKQDRLVEIKSKDIVS